MRKVISNSLLTRLFILTGILIVLTWIMTSRDIRSAASKFTAAQDIVQINSIVDDLLQAGQHIAFERGRTAVMLGLLEPASKENLDFIQERRKQSDMRMQKIIHNSAVLQNAAGQRLVKQYAAITALRKENDDAFALPRAQRSPTLIDRWVETATSTVTEISIVSLSLSLAKDSYPVSFRNFSRLKFNAYELRNAAGSETASISLHLAQNAKITGAALENIQRLRGQSAAVWNGLKRDSTLAANTAVLEAVEHIHTSFFIAYRKLLDEVLSASSEDRLSRIVSSDLTKASVPALDSMADLMSVLTKETEKDVARLRSQAAASLRISIILGIISLATGIMLLMSFTLQFLVPLNKLNKNLLSLADGNTAIDIPEILGSNEISRANSAVAVFRDSLIQRKELETKLLKMSNSDGLTGLANRRCMNESLQEEWNRTLRTGTPLGAAMFDVDFFKLYNDHYGHLAGDECLKKIAAVLTAHTQRPGDVAARFGGEEFFIILPGLSYEQIFIWAEKVRITIENLHIPHTDSSNGFVTVSCGIVSLVPSNTTSPLELIRIADERLYRAKAEGRNRTIGRLEPPQH